MRGGGTEQMGKVGETHEKERQPEPIQHCGLISTGSRLREGSNEIYMERREKIGKVKGRIHHCRRGGEREGGREGRR